MHVSVETLEDKFPGEGRSRYNAIAMLVGGDMVGAATHEGGIDLTGVFDKDNDAFDDEARQRVKALMHNKTAAPKPEEAPKEGNK